MLEATNVSRRKFITWLGGGLALAAVPGPIHAATRGRELQSVSSSGRALGTEITITVLHEDGKIASLASQAALAELQLVDELMSIYRDSSQVSLLNRVGRLSAPHPYFREVLEQAREVSVRSGGAFDVTVQPLWTLYSQSKAAGTLPTKDAVAGAREKVDYTKLLLSESAVEFGESEMSMTLNGIAQGFAADRAVAVLKSHGIAHALINTGEVAMLGRNAQGKPWTAGIQHPRRADAYVAVTELRDRSLATSGDYATSFTPDHLHHHIFDPATGDSPAELSSVSVLAPTATLADALSTAICVLGADRGMELMQQYRNVDALLIRKDGTELVTANFPRIS